MEKNQGRSPFRDPLREQVNAGTSQILTVGGVLGLLSERLYTKIKQRISPGSTFRRMAGEAKCEANYQEYGNKSQDNSEHFVTLIIPFLSSHAAALANLLLQLL